MSEAVDTRVVEARFDSAQFEKGVDRTVKKLDELKSSLNLKESGKSVADLTSKIQEGTNNASESLEKLQYRFTSFIGMLKQKFISGIADEIVGAFFRMKNSFESFVSSLSTAQIGVGMSRYTEMLTSIRTLVSAGVDQGAAYDAIERLGEYADQTSYSLDAMVSTMSKFKTAGADLQTAARMIEGLSNAAASMGVNAQQAERAYLNLQQAYSKGAMLQNDWISFESLPMVGQKFNQAIIDAAVKVGTLKASKPDKNGNVTYQTVNKAGAQVKTSGADAKGITSENMGTKLSSRWFNKEVMEKVFGDTYYFAEVGVNKINQLKARERELKAQIGSIDKETGMVKDEKWFNEEFQKVLDKQAERRRTKKIKELDDQLKNAKITQEEYNKAIDEFDKSNHLTKFAYDAFRAGQEARSLTDVLNTLKDAISRGWAKSFEYIFGTLDEAADFFTKLTESNLAEAIYAIGRFRNDVLESWKDNGGRDNMLGFLQTIDDLLGNIFEKMGLIKVTDAFDQDEYDRILEEQGQDAADAYEAMADADPFEEFAENLGRQLAMLGRDINDYIQQVVRWFTEVDKNTNESRIDRIAKVFNKIGDIISGAGSAFSKFLEGAFDVFIKLEPVLTALWNGFSKLLDPITQIFERKTADQGIDIYTRIGDAFANLSKVVDVLVGTKGHEGPLIKLIDVLADVVSFFIDIGVSTVMAPIELFTDAFGLLMEMFFGTSAQKEAGRGTVDSVTSGILSLGDACKTTFQVISDFFGAIIQDIRNWLGLNREANAEGTTNIFENISNFFKNNEALKSVKDWFDKAVENVSKWISEFPDKISKFAIDTGDLIKSLFYTKKTDFDENEYNRLLQLDPSGYAAAQYKQYAENKVEWIETEFLATIKKFIADLPGKISKFAINLGDVFKSIFYTKKTDFDENEYNRLLQLDPSGYAATQYKQYAESQVEWVEKEFTTTIKEWFASLPSKLSKFFISAGDLIKSLFYTKTEKKTVNFKTGKTKTTTEWIEKDFIKDIKKWIKDLPNNLKKYAISIGDLIKSLFYTKVTTHSGPASTPVTTWIKKDFTVQIEEFVKNIPVYIHDAFVSIGDFLKIIWDALLGNTDASSDKTVQNTLEQSIDNVETKSIFTKIQDLAERIWNDILTIFTGNKDKNLNDNWFADKVAEAINWISEKADSAWNSASNFVVNLPTTIANLFSTSEEAKEQGTVEQAINGFATNVGTWISSIPDTALSLYENAEKEVGNLWDKVITWVTGGAKPQELSTAAQGIYESIASANGIDVAEIWKTDALKQEWRQNNPILANLEDFFNNLKEYIIKKVSNFPNDVASGFAAGTTLLDQALTAVTGWFNDDNEAYKAKKKAEEDFAKKWSKLVEFDEKEYAKLVAGDSSGYAADQYKQTTTQNENYLKEKEALFGKSKESDNDFIKSISEFGSKLSSLITQTIPGFISSGFTWVKTHAESWWNALTGLFDGGEGKVDEASESFGQKVLTSLQTLFRAEDFDQNEYDNIFDYSMEEAEKYKQQHTNPILEFFRGVIADVGDIFAEIGPVILDGINKAFGWISDNIGKATTFLNGLHEEGKTLYDIVFGDAKPEKEEDQPIWNAVKSIGKTLYDIITKVIPSFIATAATDIWNMIPQIISQVTGGDSGTKLGSTIGLNLFGDNAKELIKDAKDNFIESSDIAEVIDGATSGLESMGTVFDEVPTPETINEMLSLDSQSVGEAQEGEKKSQSIGESISGIFTSIKEAFENVASNDFVKWGIILALATVLISQIARVVDNLFFLDDVVGWNAKWVGIGAALTAISAIVAWSVYLASTGNDDKLAQVKQIMNDLADVVVRIGTVFKDLATIHVAGSALSLVGSFFDWRTAKNNLAGSVGAGGQVGFLGAFLNKVLLFLGIAEGTDILTTAFENAITNVSQAIDTLSTVTGSLVKIVNDLTEAGKNVPEALKAAQDISELFNAIRSMFTIYELVDIQNVNVDDGRKGTYFTGENNTFWFLEDADGLTESALEEVTEAEYMLGTRNKKADVVTQSLIEEYQDMARMLTRVSGAIAEFKNALQIDADAKLITDDIQDLLGMTDQMAAFGEFSKTEDFENFNKAFSTLGAAISLYGFGDISSETFDENIIGSAVSLLSSLFGNDELQGLVSALTKTNFPESSEMLTKAQDIVIFAGALTSIANACADLTDDTGSNLETLFETVSKITTTTYNGKKIDEISTEFGALGNAMGTFAYNTSDLTQTNVDNAQTAITMLLELAKGLKDIPSDTILAKAFTGDKTISNFAIGIDVLGTHLKSFFDKIENIKGGQSVTYNRSNLQMALLAVQGISEGIYILARAPYINVFKKNLQGGLTDYFGNLKELAENIMAFVTEINKYTDKNKYGDIDFSFVYSIIDALNKLAEVINKIPDGYHISGTVDIGKRMDALGKILFGDLKDKGDGTYTTEHEGIIAHLNKFLMFIIGMSSSLEHGADINSAAVVISAYSELVKQVVALIIDLGKIQYGDLVADYYKQGAVSESYRTYLDPLDILLPSFASINDNFDVYTEFFNNAATFNSMGINNALKFFSGLNDIANALYIFSKKDAQTGRYNTTEGLTKLLEFNWEELRSIANEMTDVLIQDGLDTAPVITPVLNISDDFVKNAGTLRSMVGLDAFNAEAGSMNNLLNIGANIDTSFLEGFKPIDYTVKLDEISKNITTLNTTTSSLSTSISQMRIELDGYKVAQIITPQVQQEIGITEINNWRGNMNNGYGGVAAGGLSIGNV